ncbi:transposable element Tcb1 transposase [Trichonephila clavipes]|nr:transposable element Tcb1 transposase [Trichonephila clavipes]
MATPPGFHRLTNRHHATQQNGKHHFCHAQHHRLSQYGIEDCLQSRRPKENAYSTRLLHHGLRASVPLYRIPLTVNHRRLRLQWAHEHRAWQAHWHQVVFTDESLFNLWNHDGCIRVRRYAGERCLPECVIERNSGLTTGVMVWDAISYHGRSNFLRIEGNLNSSRYVREDLQPEVVPFIQGIPAVVF